MNRHPAPSVATISWEEATSASPGRAPGRPRRPRAPGPLASPARTRRPTAVVHDDLDGSACADRDQPSVRGCCTALRTRLVTARVTDATSSSALARLGAPAAMSTPALAANGATGGRRPTPGRRGSPRAPRRRPAGRACVRARRCRRPWRSAGRPHARSAHRPRVDRRSCSLATILRVPGHRPAGAGRGAGVDLLGAQPVGPLASGQLFHRRHPRSTRDQGGAPAASTNSTVR